MSDDTAMQRPMAEADYADPSGEKVTEHLSRDETSAFEQPEGPPVHLGLEGSADSAEEAEPLHHPEALPGTQAAPGDTQFGGG